MAASTPSRAVVQSAGYSYRLNEFWKLNSRRAVLCSIGTAIYAGADYVDGKRCGNRHHSLDQQLCRWLCWPDIWTNDLGDAGMISNSKVCAEWRDRTAGHLQEAGLIQYGRGH
jgi:hypothetical protein